MDRFVVHEGPGSGEAPATHVLVIGVGSYPHLKGGAAHDPAVSTHGMGQLTSPPLSARTIADLFSLLHHPKKPLGTVALLLSEDTPGTYASPGSSGAPVPVEEATADNVVIALKEWKARGDESPDNQLIFYFCGHGQSAGEEMVLLLRDFAADTDNVYDGALDVNHLRLGLEQCAAREQVFFIDACRQYPEDVAFGGGFTARTPFRATPPQGGLATRQFPTFYSTLEGFAAGGDIAAPSYFAQALAKGFSGAGATDSEGNWRVTTTQLQSALDFLLLRALSQGFRPRQVPGNSNITTFDLHHLDEPIVPVVVGCRPDRANGEATFSCRGKPEDGLPLERPPSNEDWDLDLPAREFTFEARFVSGRYQSEPHSRIIRPAYQRITLEVS